MINLSTFGLIESSFDSQISINILLTTLILSTLLGLASALIYKITFKAISYSNSFTTSLVLLNVISAMVMSIIGSNLARAFGLVGALSIIRFRTAIKDSKDITFIFLSLAIGIATGTQNFHIAIIGGIFTLVLIYLLEIVNFGDKSKNQYYLSIDVKKKNFNELELESIIKKYTLKSILSSMNIDNNSDDLIRVSYRISLSRNQETNLISAIKSMKSIKNISLVSAANYISS